MNKQLLLSATDKILLDVLKLLRKDPYGKVQIDVLQKELRLGFARVINLLNLLEAAGIISDSHKYKMVEGKDGERHRQYLPVVLVASPDELDECITELEKIRYDRIKGSIFSGAAGDALGNDVEFMSLSEIKKQYGEAGITEPELCNGKALITDDTQMMLFTAEGIFIWEANQLQNKDKSLVSCVYESYIDWLYTQGYGLINGGEHKPITKLFEIPELHAARAPGNTCISALRSGKMGTIDKPLNDSKGCGGVMRIAPVGLYFKHFMQDVNETVMMGAEIAAITHGHPLGYISAAALTYIVNEIVYGCTDTLKAVFEGAVLTVERLFPQSETEEFIELIHKAYKLADSNLSDEKAIYYLGEGWCGDSALAIAIYCCLKHDCIADVICAAVNFDGDSDSVGAIAGNIIGAWLGYNAIPEKYIINLELQNTLENTAKHLFYAESAE